MTGRLILEDGTVFQGEMFGAQAEKAGLVVFYTGVVGYQEVMTDPAYRGRIVVFSYPHIGNYGVNAQDNESPQVQPAAVIIKELSPIYSNFRAEASLEDFMKKAALVGLKSVDTRSLVVHIRDQGEMKGLVTSSQGKTEELVKKLKKIEVLPEAGVKFPTGAGLVKAGPPGKRQLAIIDLGASRSFYAGLAQSGFGWQAFGPKVKAGEILALKPAAVVLTDGPYAPASLTETVASAKEILGQAPLWGVGLGCVVLGLAGGARAVKMACGHHSGNYSVKRPAGGRGEITVQNHSFNLDEATLDQAGLQVSWRNVNDSSVEGIKSKKDAAAGTLFKPLDFKELEGLIGA